MFAPELEEIGITQVDLEKCLEVFEKIKSNKPKLWHQLSSKPKKRPKLDKRPQRCYTCKKVCDNTLCKLCATINADKKMQSYPLDGKTALVTGIRLKIGFQIALKLLRAGCVVVGSTRFPTDCTDRFELQEDSSTWIHNLHVVRADFEKCTDVEQLCVYVETQFEKLDFLINNAAQTIWRPPAFYRHLLEKEEAASLTTENDDTKLAEVQTFFPLAKYDQHGQQVDLRKENSWTMTLETTPVSELLQAQIVNCTVPFMLIQRLTPMLARAKSPTNQAHGFIINVSAAEGQFYAHSKSNRHPHTNIAKAGLNMIVRTCAGSYMRDHCIAMNCVDTGFVTNEFPHEHKNSIHVPPLDEIDGAARVLDPIFTAFITNTIFFGRFFKDYMIADW
jgi:NAD(P)-dependent dehydrogenase (short-subunit alcohol dehydrogenase family)